MNTTYLTLVMNVFLLTGIISNAQTVQVPFRGYNFNCHLKKDYSKVVITSHQELRQKTNCRTSFDFTQNILIGIRGSIAGCSQAKVAFTIVEDKESKTYHIKAFVYQRGICRRANYYNEFIYAPKPKPGYEIEFEKKVIYSDD